ncbi:MAG: diguanylate cyclase [Campylobacterales bacterium]|nr:diguanylate cyclase [Campylobacterales bacterium]MBN2832028.1 diguanylate cyclase [Campylobacterales bacterium]
MRKLRWCGILGIFWLPFSLLGIELLDVEKEYLQHHKSIRVCVDPDWAPFEMMDEHHHYTGIGADLLYLIAKRLNISVKVVPTSDWAESMRASREGKCDIVSFLNQTPLRDAWLLFTKPHFRDPNVFITREEHDFISDLHALKAERIVFPLGTAMEELIRKTYPNLKVITVHSEAEAFEMVSSKKADIAMRSLIVSAYTIKNEGMFNLKIAGQFPDYINELRIGVIKSEPLLRDILDKAIATISEDERREIVNKYVSIKAQTVHDYSLVFKIILGFIALGIILLWRYLELKKYTKELVYLSETDILTQIYNRMKIEKLLLSHTKNAHLHGAPLSILLLDIDHFKSVNDTFGHPVGDQILIQIASLLKVSLRENDCVGRWGGEEFLIICPKASLQEAYTIAKRIQSLLEKIDFPTHQHHTLSIGIASLIRDETAYDLIVRVDKALYNAKKSGRNTVCTS